MFLKTYTKADIELLAKVDNAHERLSGPATAEIMRDEFNLLGNAEFERLKNISIAHLYRLRVTPRYRENTKTFSKTKPTQVNIGERRKPEPNGKPGYLCVDSVHQGDKDGSKGIYHINITDTVTQFEFVGAVEAISEKFMKKILVELIAQFTITIIEIHSDNGSEYINRIIAELLNKLLIKQTKSRLRHSNDNGLAETKNGAVIRKYIGYVCIAKKYADSINTFYQNVFNEYLNYHRPCGFPETKINAKGKEIKIYPKENYMIPYDKFKSLPSAEKYLKPGITFIDLDKIAYAKTDIEYAKYIQEEKFKMLKIVSSINN
jgi:transposase InsO family protein